MSEQFHRRFNAYIARTRTTEGKITIFTSLVACLVLVSFVTLFQVNVPVASADNVTTSVTVLNTPPVWTVDANESTESSTSTPTNAGSTISFTAIGTDSSGDSYYLLVCKTTGAPTANASAAPTCNGGMSNQWAVSSVTVSGNQATASTSTIDTAPFNAESNDWYGWICDDNAGLPRCNIVYKQGASTTASPFVINHIPVFHSISNDAPIVPGASVTWTSGSYDNDTLGTTDTVRLVVCRTAGFSNGNCTGGLAYATSTLAASNAATSTTTAIPSQDNTYNAYVYIVDTHNLAATSTIQASNSSFVISNVAPSISPASISLVDTDNVGNLTLTTVSGLTNNFKVQFTVTDNNGCQNAAAGNEISSNIINVYRSGVASTSCRVSGDYNSNSCYTASSTLFTPHYSCSQDGASCSGATDSDATFTCTFSMWYNADATDGSAFYSAQNWLASVRSTDDNATSSSHTEGSSGNEMTSFLAFDVSQASVAFGSLQPGDANDPLSATTTLYAQGNVGLDEDIYGDTMCTNWTAPDSCDSGGINTATEIAVGNQKVAIATSTAYASGTVLTSSSTPLSVLVNVPKTTATSSPASRNTYFGIMIPVSITLAGSYSGQDTITAKLSNPVNW